MPSSELCGHPYVGLIFSFDRPMQYLLLHGHKTVGNLKALEFGRSYMIHTSKAFTIDTTYWVSQEVVPATVLPSTKYRGRSVLIRNQKPPDCSGGFSIG